MVHIVIDPRLTGAIAAIDDQAQLIGIYDLPTIGGGKLKWIDANDLTDILLRCRAGRPAQITVERSQPMPGQGVSGTFCIGVVLGSILAVTQRIQCPLHRIRPSAYRPLRDLTDTPGPR